MSVRFPSNTSPASPQAEDLARVITDNAADGIFMLDMEGCITFANPAAERIFGWSEAELLGGNLHDVLHHHHADGSDYPRDRCPIAQAYRTGRTLVGHDDVFFRKDGSPVDVSCSNAPIFNGSRVVGGVLTVRDITERKKTEEALRENEAFLRSVLDSSPDCVKVIDLEGRLVYMNGPGLCIMEIESFADFQGRRWSGLWPEEAREQIVQSISDAKAGHTARFSAFCPTAKGTPRWWDITVSPVRDQHGRVTRLLSVSRDVTAEREREAALLDSEARFRTLAEAIPQFVWACRPDGACDYLNTRWVEYTGVPEAQHHGLGWQEAVHPDDREHTAAAWDSFIRGNSPSYDVEYRLRAGDGTYRWFQARASIQRDDNGNPVRVFGTSSDISDRKEAEERQHLMTRELHHRVKNTLATVQAVISSTARRAETIDEFYQSVSDRIISLARTHTLLVDNTWGGATIEDLFRAELEPYDDARHTRIKLSGPPIRLPSEVALAVGMAAHELTTNAAKYGALSVPEGQVEVNWALQDGNDRCMTLEWIERNGPAVQAPRQKGFGSMLLERVLGRQLSGDVVIDFAPAGLHMSLTAPLLAERG